MRTRFKTSAQLAAALSLSVALLAAGCAAPGGGTGSAAPSSGSGSPAASAVADKIRVGVVGLDFSNVDPGKGFARQINSFMLETLMKVSLTGQIVPNLAESVEQTDDVTYVYHLRTDITFSSGRTLTADDVVASLDHARNPEFSESWRYGAIADITAKDASTVVVTLAQPTTSFLSVLALNGYIFDAEHQKANAENFGKPGVGVIGTGPYVLDKLDATNGTATFSANPTYWGGEPPIKSVIFQGFADQNSEAIAFRTKELDVAFPGDPRAFEATAAVKVQSVPGTRQGMFYMNTQVKPWSDVHVRRAVAYAINKDDIVNVIGGNAKPDSTIIPPTQLLAIASQEEIDAMIASLPDYSYNLDKAKAEMAQSAYPEGFSDVLRTPSYGGYVEASQAIAGQLAEIGIKLEVKVFSEAEYTSTFSKPHAEVPVAYTFFGNASPDPGAMPRLALDSSGTAVGMNNFADYVNPKVDELIRKADATSVPAERFGYYSELLAIVADDMPYVPLYAGNVSVALSDAFEWPTLNAYSNENYPYITEIKPK